MNQELKFSKEEFQQLKEFSNSLGSYLPTDKTDYIWNSYLKITGKPELKPCTCSSSGKLWSKALLTIKNYIQSIDV